MLICHIFSLPSPHLLSYAAPSALTAPSSFERPPQPNATTCDHHDPKSGKSAAPNPAHTTTSDAHQPKRKKEWFSDLQFLGLVMLFVLKLFPTRKRLVHKFLDLTKTTQFGFIRIPKTI
jgi:hypothetical protein